MLKRLMFTTDDVSLTTLRLVLGVVFFAHARKKCWAGLEALVFTPPWDSLHASDCPPLSLSW